MSDLGPVTTVARLLHQHVEAADLARRTFCLTAPTWHSVGGHDYDDGEYAGLRRALAVTDGVLRAHRDRREQARVDEALAYLGDRVISALHNEADRLELHRIHAVTERGFHAQLRADRARPHRTATVPAPASVAGVLQGLLQEAST